MDSPGIGTDHLASLVSPTWVLDIDVVMVSALWPVVMVSALWNGGFLVMVSVTKKWRFPSLGKCFFQPTFG